MSDHSSIEWTEATWNPTTGCTKVSPGCANCYIERTPPFRIAGRKFVNGHIPLQFRDNITQPLRWRRPRRVFVNSLSDLFHEEVPDKFIDRVFAVMALAPQHTFQVLTKRAERMRSYVTARRTELRHHVLCDAIQLAMDDAPRGWTLNGRPYEWPLSHVWLGVSVENELMARKRVPELLQTPAAVRFLSCEPLLAHLNIAQFINANYISVGGRQWTGAGGIHWVIVGGESGPGARPFDLAWARSIVAQCKAAGVRCFVKQLGAHAMQVGPDALKDGRVVTWTEFLRDKKGGDWTEWPADLRVREFPTPRRGD